MTAVHNREVTLSPTTVGIYTYAIYKEKKKQKQNLALPIKNKEWCPSSILILYLHSASGISSHLINSLFSIKGIEREKKEPLFVTGNWWW